MIADLLIAFSLLAAQHKYEQERLLEKESIEIRSMDLGMTPSTVTTEEGSGSLIMEEWGITMAFQTEHSPFMPLQEKLIGRSMRGVTGDTSLDTTGEMFKSEWSALLRMASGAGLAVHISQGRTVQASMRSMALGALENSFKNLVTDRKGEISPDLPVAGEAEFGRLLL